MAERDSLNAAVLGPDIAPEQPEFDLFVREVVREMTAKAGQKCTAIRRVLVPRAQEAAVIAALKAALAQIKLGDPRSEDKAMGPLVSLAQRGAVRAQIAKLRSEAEIVFGDPDTCAGEGDRCRERSLHLAGAAARDRSDDGETHSRYRGVRPGRDGVGL